MPDKKKQIDFSRYINNIRKSNHNMFTLFEKSLTEDKLRELEKISTPTYLVAMTPRSGSSYFMDLLKKTEQLGDPGEYLNLSFIPNISTSLQVNNLSDYWIKLIERKKSTNIFGIKASFFHCHPLIETGLDELLFKDNKIIFLRRKNIVKQAVSLYLANTSNIFHTNISHSTDKWKQLDGVAYDNKLIRESIEHIYIQEKGWERYLINKEFLPLYYEDIVKAPNDCINNVLSFLNRSPVNEVIHTESIFKKIGNDKNEEFFQQFINEKSNVEYLSGLNLNEERFNS